MNEAMIYPVADALNIELHEMPDGKVRGADARLFSICGVVLDGELMVVSDVLIDMNVGGYFVKLLRNLWLYVVVEYQGSSTARLTAYSFDADVVGLKMKDVASFGGASVSATLLKLKPAIAQCFRFEASGKTWTKLNVPDLDSVQ